MKKTNLILALILPAALALGMGGGWIPTNSLPPVPTVPPVPTTTNTMPGPVIAPAAAAGLVAAGDYARPVIAVGQNGRLYVAAEGPGMGSIHLFVNDGKRWTGGEIVHTDKTNPKNSAGRCYVPDIAVDSDGRCFVSFRWGNKEWGSLHGPGLWIRQADGTGKLFYPEITTGAARIEIDPTFGCVLMSKDGAWGVIGRDGAVIKRGSFPAGQTGEKFDFDIDGGTWTSFGARWVTAMNGFSRQSSCVAIGNAEGGKRQTFADHSAYPEQSDDMRYVSVLSASGKVYAVTGFNDQIMLQMFVNEKAEFSTSRLRMIGDGNKGDRCPPRLAAAQGAVYCIWQDGAAIMRATVTNGKAKSVGKIASGSQPGCATGPDGRIRLVFVSGGNLMYQVQ